MPFSSHSLWSMAHAPSLNPCPYWGAKCREGCADHLGLPPQIRTESLPDALPGLTWDRYLCGLHEPPGGIAGLFKPWYNGRMLRGFSPSYPGVWNLAHPSSLCPPPRRLPLDRPVKGRGCQGPCDLLAFLTRSKVVKDRVQDTRKGHLLPKEK